MDKKPNWAKPKNKSDKNPTDLKKGDISNSIKEDTGAFFSLLNKYKREPIVIILVAGIVIYILYLLMSPYQKCMRNYEKAVAQGKKYGDISSICLNVHNHSW